MQCAKVVLFSRLSLIFFNDIVRTQDFKQNRVSNEENHQIWLNSHDFNHQIQSNIELKIQVTKSIYKTTREPVCLAMTYQIRATTLQRKNNAPDILSLVSSILIFIIVLLHYLEFCASYFWVVNTRCISVVNVYDCLSVNQEVLSYVGGII